MSLILKYSVKSFSLNIKLILYCGYCIIDVLHGKDLTVINMIHVVASVAQQLRQ